MLHVIPAPAPLHDDRRLGPLVVIVSAAPNEPVGVLALMVMLNILPTQTRREILAALVDGCSVRAIERMTKVHRDTIVRFARKIGDGCARLHNALVRNVSCAFAELDEQHSFCLVKQGHLRPDHPAEAGDTWTWSALDRTSRLVISFHVGKRDAANANTFINDLRARLATTPQITSDGLKTYRAAVARAFGRDVPMATTVKNWGHDPDKDQPRQKAGPKRRARIMKSAVLGEPDLRMATTAHLERLHLTLRHVNGRLRRRCLAFSKSLESHRAVVSLTMMYVNFVKEGGGRLKMTPAVRAGLADHAWTLDELLDAALAAPAYAPPEPQPLLPRAA